MRQYEQEWWTNWIKQTIYGITQKIRVEMGPKYEQMKADALEEAVEKLGLTEQYEKLADIESQIDELVAQRKDVQEQMWRQATGLDGEAPDWTGYYNNGKKQVEEATNILRMEIMKEKLAGDPQGSKLLQLEQWKTSAEVTVMLAKSSKEIKALFPGMATLLGVEVDELLQLVK